MTSYSTKLLITGSNGQLGTALRMQAKPSVCELIPCTRAELDIVDMAMAHRVIAEHAPNFIINTAAYTAVDKAEQEQDACDLVNHLGAKNLAIICEDLRIPLIHLSTDYVFDGAQVRPYQEDDDTHPVNYYGLSKWLGEQAIRDHCEQHIILRVSGVFSGFGTNFAKSITRLARERKQLRIVADQITCPTSAADIADTIYQLVRYQNSPHWGTYHYCSSNAVSWYQFAVAIIEHAKKHESLMVETIDAITTAEYPTAARRPAYSVLDSGKIKRDYDIPQPSWEKALARLFTTNS